MSELLPYYLPLVIFIAVAFVICVGLLVVPFVIAYKQPDPEKLSAYECGFNAFDDARMKFDVRYYLVAIPEHPLLVNDLPPPIRELLSRTAATLRWMNCTYIDGTMTEEW